MKTSFMVVLTLASLTFSVTSGAEEGWWNNMGVEMIPDDDPVGLISRHRLVSLYTAKPVYFESDSTLKQRRGANAQRTEFGLFVRTGTEVLGKHLERNHLLSDIAENEGKSFGLYLTRRFR